MSRHRRVTLRCICEDLKKDWATPSDQAQVRELRRVLSLVIGDKARLRDVGALLRQIPRINALRHPLIGAFEDQFAGADDASTLRETISSVSDRPWLKQTFSSRWRGAATIVAATRADGLETVWLGAAGYHRAGSPEDFYEWFAGECGSGSDKFLPQPEDLKLDEIDEKISQRDAWKAQLHLSVLVLLANAVENGVAGPLQVLRPATGPEVLMEVVLSVDSVEIDDETISEVIVEILPIGHEYAKLVEVGTSTVVAAISDDTLAWTAAPLTAGRMSYRALGTSLMIGRAISARESGEFDGHEVPGDLRMGTVAHYAKATGLTEATVVGEPIQAICGHWFVPMHDHAELAPCASCAEKYAHLD